uniref:Uncharacterized protein n=1 Tax=Anguilla anguilla TaxID=7936 RepID=A0A0E9QD32_ANGAN
MLYAILTMVQVTLQSVSKPAAQLREVREGRGP